PAVQNCTYPEAESLVEARVPCVIETPWRIPRLTVTSRTFLPILRYVQTPDPLPPPVSTPRPRPLGGDYDTPIRGRYWGLGELLTLVAGLVLTLSAFTDWYAGSESGGAFTLSVIGWHAGALGKVVFFCGLAVLALIALREAG